MLSFRNVSYGWNKDNLLQQHLSFDLKKGSITCVLGTNGCGKSSLFALLSGATLFFTGKIECVGSDFASLTSKERATNISVISQSTPERHSLTVLSYVLTGWYPFLGFLSHPSKKEFDLSITNLKKLGIYHWKDRFIEELSGGEFKLVQLARALCGNRPILLFDEVDATLDLANKIKLMKLIKDLALSGTSILMITHDPNLALALHSKVLMLGKHQESLFGDATEIITPNNLSKYFGIKVIKTKDDTEKLIQMATLFDE